MSLAATRARTRPAPLRCVATSPLAGSRAGLRTARARATRLLAKAKGAGVHEVWRVLVHRGLCLACHVWGSPTLRATAPSITRPAVPTQPLLT